MKKHTLLNSDLSYHIASLGHTQSIAIADAGLPIPQSVGKVDLALSKGVPDFLKTLEITLTEMQVEKAIFAKEALEHNDVLYKNAVAYLEKSNPDVVIEKISHEDFKKETYSCEAIVRTGECTPYANVILISGVTF